MVTEINHEELERVKKDAEQCTDVAKLKKKGARAQTKAARLNEKKMKIKAKHKKLLIQINVLEGKADASKENGDIGTPHGNKEKPIKLDAKTDAKVFNLKRKVRRLEIIEAEFNQDKIMFDAEAKLYLEHAERIEKKKTP
jgi:hypothetical protein